MKKQKMKKMNLIFKKNDYGYGAGLSTFAKEFFDCVSCSCDMAVGIDSSGEVEVRISSVNGKNDYRVETEIQHGYLVTERVSASEMKYFLKGITAALAAISMGGSK